MKGSPDRSCNGALKGEVRGSFLQLENIQEDAPSSFPSPTLYPEPQTPQEPIEFLSRSWSISAVEVSRATKSPSVQRADGALIVDSPGLETPPFVLAPSITSQIVMDRIMEHSLFSTPRRNSHSSGPLICHNSGILAASPPPSPRQDDSQTANAGNRQLRGRSSMGRWFKDMKERRKEMNRAHNAEVHAAVSMAGVAAAVAAVAAATAASAAAVEDSSKTSMAVASAASLVAAQCVELAESLGADHQHVSSVVSSAVNVKTAGDIMTLTAAAATALRGAATLKARNVKDAKSLATVTPYDKHGLHSGDFTSEDGDTDYYTQELLAKGCDFLKRSKKGELHWRQVSVHMDNNGQVAVKVQSKHLGLRKKRNGVVLEVDANIPAWPGRSLLDSGDQRHYFGLKTSTGMLEFECKSEYEHRVWTQGIAHLLSLSNQQSLALTTTARQ